MFTQQFTWLGLVLLAILTTGCQQQREQITVAAQANETFYVENQGAQMRVTVQGNTASGIFILVLAGGPSTPVDAYRTVEMRDLVEHRYAVVYYDQRNAGSSQGGANTDQMRLATYRDDTDRVFQVLRHRYGLNKCFFILSHSWGALLAPTFLVRNQQANVRGWINLDGNYDTPLTIRETRRMLLETGPDRIQAGDRVDRWQEILDYCRKFTTIQTRDEIYQYNTLGGEVSDWFVPIELLGIYADRVRRFKTPLVAAYQNAQYGSKSNEPPVNGNELYRATERPLVAQIRVPVANFYGRYDFVCPASVGDSLFAQLGSSVKETVIFDQSAHNPFLSEPTRFCQELVRFIENHK